MIFLSLGPNEDMSIYSTGDTMESRTELKILACRVPSVWTLTLVAGWIK